MIRNYLKKLKSCLTVRKTDEIASSARRVMEKIKIGTRGSNLALFQAELAKKALQSAFPDLLAELVVITTKGDKIQDVALSKIGDKGLFTKELDMALLRKEIDVAVHSLKDMPTTLPEGITLGAVLEREDPRDALLSRDKKNLNQLGENERIATSSLRRKAGLLHLNPGFRIVDIRGNVNTRIKKMESGYCDAMVMAVAGLKRVNMEHYITEIIPPATLMPAVSQGAIGIEIRMDDAHMERLMQKINHQPTRLSVSAERAFLKRLEGGCQIPSGCYTQMKKGSMVIYGFIAATDGSRYIKDQIEGPAEKGEELGKELADILLEKGGREVLRQIREPFTQHSGNNGNTLIQDKVFISTRPAGKSEELADYFASAGARVAELPMIEIRPLKITREERKIIKEAGSFNWLIFSSVNGVEYFMEIYKAEKGSFSLPPHIKIAAIGKKTAGRLKEYGVNPGYVSDTSNSRSFSRELRSLFAGRRPGVLWPTGELSPGVLEKNLSSFCDIKRLNLYRTSMPSNTNESCLQLVKEDKYEIIFFFSPSAARNFCSVIDGLQIQRESLRVACIGPETEKACLELGLKPLYTASSPCAESLYEATLNYMASENDNN